MNFTTVDLEWKKETAELLCACFYNEKQNDFATSISDFLDKLFAALDQPNNIIYAHFGGGSDFLFFLREIVGKPGYYLNEKEFFEVGGKIIYFTVRHDNKVYQFRDSYALLPSSLAKLGLSFVGETKLFDSANLETLPLSEIIQHCQQDCKLLWQVINNFRERLQIDELPLTAATLALNDLQAKSDFTKLLPQSKKDYNLLIPWFKGGHTDVYKRYAAPCWHYDINSCYSASQYHFGCPVGKGQLTNQFEPNKCGLYIAKIESKIDNPFTWRIVNDRYDKLFFLNSNGYFYVTDIELEFFQKHNVPFKVQSGFFWEKDADFFKKFVEHWYEYRQKGIAEKEIGKIYLNAGGYGKFAIRRERESIKFGEGCDYYFSPDFEIGVKRTWKDFWYSQIHIAARITAGARVLLFEAQQRVGAENLVYSDTDSVYSTKPIPNFVNEKFLGGLKMEGEYKRAYFLGNKFYGKVNPDDSFSAVLKGFPDKNFVEEQYKNALDFELNFKYISQRLLKFRSALRRASDFVAIREFVREVKNLEIKRKILKNKIDTRPFFMRGEKLT